ncbi:MAG: sporulation protein YpjB [Bacillaceae bacterium]|nr:sporulation protein YpjB [Bacillaceae bacterium]
MGKKVILLLSIFIIIYSIPIKAEEQYNSKQWLELNHTADQVLQLVKEEKYTEAKQLLDLFSKQFLSIRTNEDSLTMTQLRIITASYENALGAVTSVSLAHEQRVNAVAELRLVIDSFTSKHHPLWKQTEAQVLDRINKMKTAIESGDQTQFNYSLNEFLQSYGMIRSAIMVSIEPHQFQRIEAHVKFLEKYRGENYKRLQQNKEQITVMKKRFSSNYIRVLKKTKWILLFGG